MNNENAKGLSFVIPAYNEEGSIVGTIDRVHAVLSGLGIPFEIIVVNDGSTDRTKELVEKSERIKVINHPVNIGYGNSLKSGIRKSQYEWIGIVDADGAYPIEEIPALFKEMTNGFDMVVASRANSSAIDSFSKRIFRWIFVKIIRVLNDSRIEDPNSGLRLFKRDLAIKLMPFLCGTFSFTTSLTILTSGMYYFIKYVPVEYQKREGKSKVRHFRDSIRTFFYIMQGIIFFNPIKYFLLLSVFMISFVCLPAMVIAMLNHPVFSLYYLIFGTAVVIMIGMGGLGDIIRISVERQN